MPLRRSFRSKTSRLERLAPGEGEEAAGQVLGVLGRLDEPFQHHRAAVLGQPRAFQELRPAGDHLEDVVEVVGDAAGELADGLQLLALAQSLLGAALLLTGAHECGGALLDQPAQLLAVAVQHRFGRLALLNVLDDGNEVLGGPTRVADQRDRQQYPDQRPVLAVVALLQAVGRDLARQELLDIGEVRLEIVRMGDVLEGLGKKLGFAIAQHLAQATVDPQPGAVEANHGDSDRRQFERGSKPLLAFGEGELGPFTLVDIVLQRVFAFREFVHRQAQRFDDRRAEQADDHENQNGKDPARRECPVVHQPRAQRGRQHRRIEPRAPVQGERDPDDSGKEQQKRGGGEKAPQPQPQSVGGPDDYGRQRVARPDRQPPDWAQPLQNRLKESRASRGFAGASFLLRHDPRPFLPHARRVGCFVAGATLKEPGRCMSTPAARGKRLR